MTTDISGLCLWRNCARSIIIVQSTRKAGPAGGIWGDVLRRPPRESGAFCGVVGDKREYDDFACDGSLYVNGVARHLQEYNSPGILEAYRPSPKTPVFYQTAMFGYPQQEQVRNLDGGKATSPRSLLLTAF